MKKVTEELDLVHFLNLGQRTIQELEVANGILASSATEAYGSLFGRDSDITGIRLLRVSKEFPQYLALTKKIIAGLLPLLGKEVNIESGEEPGKCIHNYIPENYEQFTRLQRPWFIYPDGLKNYDSVDATPLLVICFFRYLKKSGDFEFAAKHLHEIESALNWIMNFGDHNGDGLIDYQMHPNRKSGGLSVQSWMDGYDSVFHEDGSEVSFPVAPIEVQAYAYLAVMLASEFYKNKNSQKSSRLWEFAMNLKKSFNDKFVIESSSGPTFPFAIDNNGKPLVSKRSSIGHLLWSAINLPDDGRQDCILEDRYIDPLVKSVLEPDIFEPEAGVRTLSKCSRMFNSTSYQNGTFWPHDNSIIAEGLENFGYSKEANLIRKAVFRAFQHFNTPVELYLYENGEFMPWRRKDEAQFGTDVGCSMQAWSAASMIVDSLALMKNQP